MGKRRGMDFHWACWALAGALWGGGGEAAYAGYEDGVVPILVKKCYSCHGPEKQKADLNLSLYKTNDQARGAREVFDKAIERINAHEMPPEGSPQLNDPERDILHRWHRSLPKLDNDCSKIANDRTMNFYRGYVMSRRLTRTEYDNTLRDLVGLDLKPSRDFPADGSGGEGFDNCGDSLFTSPILMEKYLAAAEKVVDAALPLGAGPFPPEVAKARQRLMPASPGPGLSERDAARECLATLTRRAFRRPSAPADVERYLKLYDRAMARGDGHLAAMRLAIKGVLVSPHFLFMIEMEPEKEGVYALGGAPLASRLSYFLWSSMPDDELLGLAESGKLADLATLRGQVRRMLADPKSQALGQDFAIQWLGLGPLGQTVKPDGKRFPEFTAELAQAMRDEAAALFNGIVRDNRPLMDLIDCDYAYVNERLAAIYGLPDVKGPELRKVALPDKRRGGVLGLAGVHALTSYPLRTSPVLRGKWVLEELLGSHVPPPPPDVPTLPADESSADGLTFRKRFELHRSKAECAACHARMDPLGFGLENYDVLGRWRDQSAGQPIDASGELPGGGKFAGPVELKKLLATRREEILRNLCKKMVGYGLARPLNRFDHCVVDDAMKALKENEHRPAVLFETIVLSKPFLTRFAKK